MPSFWSWVSKQLPNSFETADQKEGMGAFLEKRKHEPYQNR